MNDEAVRERARRAGIAVDWVDSADRPQRVSTSSLDRILQALDADHDVPSKLVTGVVGQRTLLPDLDKDRSAMLELEDGSRHSLTLRADAGVPPLPIGYHTLRQGERELTLAIAPPRCVTFEDIAPRQKLWGLAAQIYSLRREGDGGIGDTTAVAELATAAAGQGADAIALSPMHALFPSDLSRYSPYAPSSRLFLNPLLSDPASVLGRDRVRVAGRCNASLIDWPTAARAKYALLRSLFDDFVARDLASGGRHAMSFHAFVYAHAHVLEEHARLEAKHGKDATPPLFHAFLQWIADGALASVQAAARQAGMSIGLIADLAIGLERDGTEVNARPRDYLRDLSIGAPPDFFNAGGQDWGLTTFSPHGLKASGFAPFIATLRAALRHVGGLRIDHALGLMRMWVVPQGSPSTEGAYLAYPFEDLIRLLALESHRHGAVIIGEDLGTVPEGFRARLRNAGIAGMDVLWFQRNAKGFLPPAEWRDDAVAMTTTHDLPTVAGWWRGSDLEVRRALGKATEEEIARRPAERALLWDAFLDSGVANGLSPPANATDNIVDMALEFVSRAPDPLTLMPLEDIAGIVDQPNLPGTIDEHPNWRRRFALPADEMLKTPEAKRRLALLKRHQP